MTDKTKPEIDFIEGPAPTELVITDLEVGDGAEATPGATVDVHYVGVDFETGEQFDASWDRGSSIQFPLSGLIKGWQDGIPGMKVGGRRQLVCPPNYAYGPAGSGHRLGGRTLVFVIDLLGVRCPDPLLVKRCSARPRAPVIPGAER
jgi:peptidylprolyl isomerase